MTPSGGLRLATPAEMGRIDRRTIEAGTPGMVLMERAGLAVAQVVRDQWDGGPVAVLCGPGNNGGDGFVAARILAADGFDIRLSLLGEAEKLKGDARTAFERWNGTTGSLADAEPERCGAVVDGLFGAGLTRPLDGTAAEAVERVVETCAATIAIDLPSGVSGETGEVLGPAFQATHTVTFGCAKPGHFLYPGRAYRGELKLADIGLEADAIAAETSALWQLHPALFRHAPNVRRPEQHKYARGHALIVGGSRHRSGAARLAATTALRAGTGLVSVACPTGALDIYASHLTSVMVAGFTDADGLSSILEDNRLSAVLFGPAAGIGEVSRAAAAAIRRSGRPSVFDADALTSFADGPEDLFALLDDTCVLTPHAGEASRLFSLNENKVTRVRDAARRSGAVCLIKGADTVVAAPDGRAAVQTVSSPKLATAGSGDCLAGLITGFLAQGMPAFEAAGAAIWIHSQAALEAGGALTAEGLSERIGDVAERLLTPRNGIASPEGS
ncbi:MAG: NAD(P)H-hydrate dehydratase [Geminicoccaceae bacterium]